MDILQTCRNYVERMLKDVPGMKILLLDCETVSALSFNLACILIDRDDQSADDKGTTGRF